VRESGSIDRLSGTAYDDVLVTGYNDVLVTAYHAVLPPCDMLQVSLASSSQLKAKHFMSDMCTPENKTTKHH